MYISREPFLRLLVGKAESFTKTLWMRSIFFGPRESHEPKVKFWAYYYLQNLKNIIIFTKSETRDLTSHRDLTFQTGEEKKAVKISQNNFHPAEICLHEVTEITFVIAGPWETMGTIVRVENEKETSGVDLINVEALRWEKS